MTGNLPVGTVTFLLTDVERSTRLWEEHPRAMSAALTGHDVAVAKSVQANGGSLVKHRGEGDSSFSVFVRPTDALRAALALQRELLKTSTTSGPFTARESEVVELLATGLTNRRIAERLVVSVRTVDTHVEHIRNKLGLRTRAEIASWVTAQQPDTAAPTLRVRCAIHTGEAEPRDGDYYGSTVNRCARVRDVAHGGQILVSKTTADLAKASLPERASLRDLGSHRLRDLLEPEHLFQVCHPDLPGDFPPVRSLDVLPTNLPIQLASFVGRHEEIAEVRKLLESTRLVTLTGTAGVGKSSIALRVGAEVSNRYPDGVWLVELAPVTDSLLISAVAAAVLGIRVEGPGESGQAVAERVLEHMRTRTILIVLDNCEHLSAECSRFAETILRACPDLCVLATSRQPLGAAGESVWRVPSLSIPNEDMNEPEALDEFGAVRLFVDRAQQATSDFRMTSDNAEAIAEICRRLDGIPLALELAAARTTVLSPHEIADRLGDQFKLLTGGSRAALERHQTMRAALDWSYEHLEPAEKVLLARSSVFAGGFALDAAEKVCSDDGIASEEVLDVLHALVRKSLVTREERTRASRYRLLEPIRQYAREKLVASGEAAVVRDRHFDYFADLAEPARALYPYSDRPGFGPLLDALEDDHDNLRAAMDWKAGTTEEMRLATALTGFWDMRGHMPEALSRLERSLQATDTEPLLRAQALRAVAAYRAHTGGATNVIENLLEEALSLSRELDDAAGIVRALNVLLYIADRAGDVERGLAIADEAMVVAESSGDDRVLHDALWMVGYAVIFSGNMRDLPRAKDAFERAVAIDRRTGKPGADSTWGLGHVALWEGDLTQAQERFAEGFRLATEEGHHWFAARNCDQLGTVALCRGELEDARVHLEQAIELCRRSGVTRLLNWDLGKLVCALVGQARDANALDRVEERLVEDADEAALVLMFFRAMRALLEGRFEGAEREATEAASVGRLVDPGLTRSHGGVHRFLARHAVGVLDEEDVAGARGAIDAGRDPLNRAMLGFVLAELGRHDDARVELESIAWGGRVRLSSHEYRAGAVMLLAHICARLGDADRAGMLYETLLPSSGHVVMFGPAGCMGAADRYLGMLAAAKGRSEGAERHFEAAIALEDALGARPHSAFTRYEYARVLVAHGGRSEGSALLDSALTTARELGMRKLERDVLELQRGESA